MKYLFSALLTLCVIQSNGQNRKTFLKDSARIDNSTRNAILIYLQHPAPFEFIADLNYAKPKTGSTSLYNPMSGTVASFGLSALLSAATTTYENYDAGKSVYQLDMETGEYF